MATFNKNLGKSEEKINISITSEKTVVNSYAVTNRKDTKYGIFLSKRNILVTSTFTIFLVVGITSLLIYYLIGSDKKNLDDFENEVPHRNVPMQTDIDKVLIQPKKLRFISRPEWLAQPSGPVSSLKTPVPYVVITHTATENCTDQASCTFHVRFIQTFHVESRNWSDIGYNFLVGGDGSVYEGRGWDTVGAHTMNYNAKSIGIAFIGTFNKIVPPERQLIAAKNIIQLGVKLNKIDKNYKLFGHRQLIPTLSPGDALFAILRTWPHFSEEL